MKFFVAVLLIFLINKQASAFCSWPCNWQGKTFFNDAGNAKISFPNAYTLEVKFGGITTKIECVQRNGQYLINRRPGATANTYKYRCFTWNNVGEYGFVIHSSDLVEAANPPDFCDLCSATKIKHGPEVWVGEKFTALACNVPKNCPSKSSSNHPCTGCEAAQSDDGICCNQCKDKKKDENVQVVIEGHSYQKPHPYYYPKQRSGWKRYRHYD